MKNIFSVIFLLCLCCCKIAAAQEAKLTKHDSLEFLVRHSSLIAVAELSQPDSIVKSWFKLSTTKYVTATVTHVVKGARVNQLRISSVPKYNAPGVVMTNVNLQSGRFLVFLCEHEDYYRPTTGLSLMDISLGKIYPIWKQTETINGLLHGYPVESVLEEISSFLER